MTSHKYKQLEDNEIRVLKAPPTTHASWQLVHIKLDSKPLYTALSYTWGEPKFSNHIMIDGYRFPITENLHNALAAVTPHIFAQKGLFASRDFLWIDAICINQADDQERSHQVRMMRRIYEQAHRIYVWLGRPTNGLYNSLAFDKMEEFYKLETLAMKKSRPYSPWWMPKGPAQSEIPTLFVLIGPPQQNKAVFDKPGTATHNAWLGICEILRSGWWHRTWVFQEATVPEEVSHFYIEGVKVFRRESKVKFLYGSLMTSWSQLVVTSLIANDLQRYPALDTKFMRNVTTPLTKVLELRNSRTRSLSLDFLSLLQVFRPTQCGDPRDKIYAPLGLASDIVTNQLIPDYSKSKSPLSTYMDVAQLQLRNRGHELDFLGYTMMLDMPVRTPSNGIQWSAWPSWLPNWDDPLDLTPLPKTMHIQGKPHGLRVAPYNRRSALDDLTKTITNVYNASLGVTPEVTIEGLRLAVRGALCDEISEILGHDSLDSSENSAEYLASVFRMMQQAQVWGRARDGMYVNGETFTAALNRTLVADVKYNNLAHVYERGGFVDYDYFRRGREHLPHAEQERYDNQGMALRQAVHRRSLCRTGHSGLIGLVPDTARKGDVISSIVGGEVMYVIRPKSVAKMEFYFVGECYIHALMDGETIKVGNSEPTMDVCERFYLV